jgi:cell wall-associated NlpC family hydrolase
MVTGAEVDRSVTVEAQAGTVTTAVGAPAPVTRTEVVLRQRPLLSRRMLTALTVVGSVAAAATLVWFGKVSAADPVTMQAPPSFFARPASTGDAAIEGHALAAFSTRRISSVAPPGALPKTGRVPAGVGGQISGTVAAANDAQPVNGIHVQAYRTGPHGLIATSSTTSQADGSYTLAGLFPTSYYLKFSAAGYVTRWYPNVSTPGLAQHVSAIPQGVTGGVNAQVTTEPASISGTVKSGNALTTVTVRPLLGPRTGQVIATATTRGAYRLPGLSAPSAYALTFTAPGYQESTLVDAVGAGQDRLEPAVSLGAGLGQISGVITDGTQPLGGANVRTMVNGIPLDVITPGTGTVGAYTLANLPTPATYTITYSSPGHGTISETVALAAGQRRASLNVSLPTGGPLGAEPLPAADSVIGGAGETEAERIAVTFALAQLGKPYVFDAAGPNAYDCSGLTMAAWAAAGVTLPHNAAAQWQEGTAVPDPLLLVPGDLIFIPGADGTWNPPHPGHVGMYIGGGYVIEAPQTGDVVKIVPLSTFGPIIGMRHIA